MNDERIEGKRAYGTNKEAYEESKKERTHKPTKML